MNKIMWREYRPSDLEEVMALDLRDTDSRELKALRASKTIPEIIKEGATSGGDVYVALVDGEIIGLFGNQSFTRNPDFGIVWSFGTNKAYEHMDELNVLAAKMIEKWLEMYPEGIGNVMSLENNPAVKWIKGFGFTFIGRVMEINDVPFQMFKKRRSNV